MYIAIPHASSNPGSRLLPQNKRPGLKAIKSMSLPFLLMLMLQQKQTFLKEAVGVGVVEEGRAECWGGCKDKAFPTFLSFAFFFTGRVTMGS